MANAKRRFKVHFRDGSEPHEVESEFVDSSGPQLLFFYAKEGPVPGQLMRYIMRYYNWDVVSWVECLTDPPSIEQPQRVLHVPNQRGVFN